MKKLWKAVPCATSRPKRQKNCDPLWNIFGNSNNEDRAETVIFASSNFCGRQWRQKGTYYEKELLGGLRCPRTRVW